MSELVLGTAQWGNAYGVTNAVGRLSDEELGAIVAVAHESGVSSVDTARGYGDAEERLRPFASQFDVTTKISGGSDVAVQVEASLEALGLSSVGGVLLHDWDQLDCKGQGMSVLGFSALLESDKVSRVGVSVYDAAGLETAAETFDAAGVPLGEIQVPANVLDRRLDSSQLLIELAESGSRIVVRSAFLQGVLLASGGGLADHPDVMRFRESVGDGNLLNACLGHVKALPWASHVVVGVTSAAELEQIVSVWEECSPVLVDESCGSSDLDVIDPRRW